MLLNSAKAVFDSRAFEILPFHRGEPTAPRPIFMFAVKQNKTFDKSVVHNRFSYLKAPPRGAARLGSEVHQRLATGAEEAAFGPANTLCLLAHLECKSVEGANPVEARRFLFRDDLQALAGLHVAVALVVQDFDVADVAHVVCSSALRVAM